MPSPGVALRPHRVFGCAESHSRSGILANNSEGVRTGPVCPRINSAKMHENQHARHDNLRRHAVEILVHMISAALYGGQQQ